MMIQILLVLLLSSIISPTGAQSQQSIIDCNPSTAQLCATTSNRTCYNYTSSHECSTCLNGFIEYKQECYSIDELQDAQFFNILSEMIETFTPEYANATIPIEERAQRLVEVAKVVSYWRSLVPPVQFSLKLNLESTLTLEERKMRLGVDSNIVFDVDEQDNNFGRGVLGRFVVAGINDDDDEEEEEEIVNDDVNTDNSVAESESSRRLTATTPTKKKKQVQARRKLQDNPPVVDWHEAGYTTIVKNQGICGSCWAVSTVAAIESALMITNKTNRVDAKTTNNLSFQQMISCDTKNAGCDGGNILHAAKYAWENNDFNNDNYGGLVSYEEYPYDNFFGEKKTDACETASKTPVAFLNYPKVVNSVNDRSSFEKRRDLMLTAVAQQPVPMTLKSNCNLFMSYDGGILTHDVGCECCKTKCIDHAVVLVGYNTTHNPPYWKIRNSWGSNWGEEGHVRIAMNQPGCGWGLFGMLSEGLLMEDGYTTKEELPERPSWWKTATRGAKALVILGSLLGLCIISSCVGFCLNRFRKSSE